MASSADDVIPALGLPPPPPPALLARFTWVCTALPPPPTCGERRPDGGGGAEPKEAGPGRGCRARRQPAGLHTIARLRLGPKVRPHGGRPSPLAYTVPSHFTLRLHGVPSAITGPSQSRLPPSEPALATVSSENAPLSERTPPPRSPGAPPAPRGPQRPALRTPGLGEPGGSGVRRTRGGRPRTLPRSLRARPPPGGGGGGAERAQKVRAAPPTPRPVLPASRRPAEGAGLGKTRGQGRQVSRGGLRPARPTDRSLRANKGPLCQLQCDRGFPQSGHWGTPRAGTGRGGPTGPGAGLIPSGTPGSWDAKTGPRRRRLVKQCRLSLRDRSRLGNHFSGSST